MAATNVTNAMTRRSEGETPDPRSIAARVKREHGMLRALLDEVERASLFAERRHPGGLPRFRQAVWDLYLAFEEHLAMEEKYVAPILRVVDAWGELRAVNMILEHNEQRRLMLELVEDTEVDAKDVDALVAEAMAFVNAFRQDMAVEEHSLASLLAHHDGFVPNQEGG
jgi:hemerythrin-like domain-containing protein